MRIDFKGILEGAWNSVFVKDSIEEVHKERMKICMNCPLNSNTMKEKAGYKTFRPDLHCTACGCNLDMKTRCISCSCPQEKWKALATEEEEEKITNKIKEDGEGSKS